MRSRRARPFLSVACSVVVLVGAIAVVGLVSGSSVPPAQAGCAAPSDVLDLTGWKLQLPTGQPGDVDEIEQPDLDGFVADPWFVPTGDCTGIRFRSAVNGVTTSGSDSPRSELREMTADGLNEAEWSTSEGTHTMTVRGMVTHLPEETQEVIAAQVHGGDAGFLTGFNLQGTSFYVDAYDSADHHLITDSYELGTPYELRFVAGGGQVELYFNGQLETTIPADSSTAYFKTGAYTQANCEESSPCDETNYGETVVCSVEVSHEDTSAGPADDQEGTPSDTGSSSSEGDESDSTSSLAGDGGGPSFIQGDEEGEGDDSSASSTEDEDSEGGSGDDVGDSSATSDEESESDSSEDSGASSTGGEESESGDGSASGDEVGEGGSGDDGSASSEGEEGDAGDDSGSSRTTSTGSGGDAAGGGCGGGDSDDQSPECTTTTTDTDPDETTTTSTTTTQPVPDDEDSSDDDEESDDEGSDPDDDGTDDDEDAADEVDADSDDDRPSTPPSGPVPGNPDLTGFAGHQDQDPGSGEDSDSDGEASDSAGEGSGGEESGEGSGSEDSESSGSEEDSTGSESEAGESSTDPESETSGSEQESDDAGDPTSGDDTDDAGDDEADLGDSGSGSSADSADGQDGCSEPEDTQPDSTTTEPEPDDTTTTTTAPSSPAPADGFGRIALAADGNLPDVDDFGGTAMALAMLAHEGLQDNVVNYTYGNYIWESDPDEQATMREIALEGAERFGFDPSVFFDASPEGGELEAAVANLTEEINRSTPDDVLTLVLAGPMETAGMALERANPEARTNVRCVSHGEGTFNQTESADHAGEQVGDYVTVGYTYPDLLDLGCQRVQIPDQNPGVGRTDMGPWEFLLGMGDPDMEWLYERIEQGEGSIADAGMVFFVITGMDTGSRDDVQAFLTGPSGAMANPGAEGTIGGSGGSDSSEGESESGEGGSESSEAESESGEGEPESGEGESE